MKSIIVTGASRGIGKFLAEQFAHRGFRVYALARSFEGDYRMWSHYIIPCLFDVVQIIEWDLFFQKYFKTSDELVGLINNAGVKFESPLGADPLSFLPDLDAMYYTNVRGAFYAMNTVVKHWREYPSKDTKRIINISSNSVNYLDYNKSFYGATKAALSYFTKSWAMELASKNIFVGEIQPGYLTHRMSSKETNPELTIETDAIPVGRTGSLAEVFISVEFLLHAPMFSTGCSIKLTGGQ